MFRRANADTHLILIIVGFAFSVLGIRAYLYLTGYPQLGGGGLHIAHMLWGGLAMFAAATTILLYRGLFLSRIAAFVIGVGWGFFIDEVGKFITDNNDYFFAPAAVIIYIIFLAVVAVYLKWFRRPVTDKEAADSEAFSDIRELMDGVAAGELTHRERELLEKRIARLKYDDERRYRDLGIAFEAFLTSRPVSIRQQQLDRFGALVEAMIQKATRGHWFSITIVTLLAIDLFVGLTTLFGFPGVREPLFAGPSDVPLAITHGTLTIVRLLAEAGVVAGLIAFQRGAIRVGRRLMIGNLLFMIIVLDSVDFYVSQFSASYTVLLDVILLVLVEARYGNERLHPERISE